MRVRQTGENELRVGEDFWGGGREKTETMDWEDSAAEGNFSEKERLGKYTPVAIRAPLGGSGWCFQRSYKRG